MNGKVFILRMNSALPIAMVLACQPLIDRPHIIRKTIPESDLPIDSGSNKDTAPNREVESKAQPETKGEPQVKADPESKGKANKEQIPTKQSDPAPKPTSPVKSIGLPVLFTLANVKDKCIEGENAFATQSDCSFENESQLFTAEKKSDNVFTFKAAALCFDLREGKAAVGTRIARLNCRDDKSQQWKVSLNDDKTISLAPVMDTGKCLNLKLTAGVATNLLTLENCTNSLEQKFVLTDSSKRSDKYTMADNAPMSIKEDWFEHNDNLTQVYRDNEIVIYGDDLWKAKPYPEVYEFCKGAWAYYKRFSAFGDHRLYLVLHGGQNHLGSGHPSGYYNERHHFRNVLDVGVGRFGDPNWQNQHRSLILHEMAHIFEDNAFGTRGSPGFGLWGDSKLFEIILYDAYTYLKDTKTRDAEAKSWASQSVSTNAGDAAKPGTKVDGSPAFWFRDWFFPLYNKYGADKVLTGFFRLLSTEFPKNGIRYAKDLNWGEYTHFMSGAVGENVKGTVTSAFGWDNKREDEFQKARSDFPNIKY